MILMHKCHAPPHLILSDCSRLAHFISDVINSKQVCCQQQTCFKSDGIDPEADPMRELQSGTDTELKSEMVDRFYECCSCIRGRTKIWNERYGQRKTSKTGQEAVDGSRDSEKQRARVVEER